MKTNFSFNFLETERIGRCANRSEESEEYSAAGRTEMPQASVEKTRLRHIARRYRKERQSCVRTVRCRWAPDHRDAFQRSFQWSYGYVLRPIKFSTQEKYLDAIWMKFHLNSLSLWFSCPNVLLVEYFCLWRKKLRNSEIGRKTLWAATADARDCQEDS